MSQTTREIQTMTHYPAILQLNRLRLSVHLGASESERAQPQAVEVDIHFFLPELPDGATDDHSEHYICYGTLSEALIGMVEGRSFRLVEYLAHQLYTKTREYLVTQYGASYADSIHIRVQLHKLMPPVPALLGGASFVYSDVPKTESV